MQLIQTTDRRRPHRFCVSCGCDISHRLSSAKYCKDCCEGRRRHTRLQIKRAMHKQTDLEKLQFNLAFDLDKLCDTCIKIVNQSSEQEHEAALEAIQTILRKDLEQVRSKLKELCGGQDGTGADSNRCG